MTGSIIRRPAASGFSLVELLVVLALIGILALIGMPWMLGTLHRAKLVATAREASTLMQGARLEAIKRSAPTMVRYDVNADAFSVVADLTQPRDGVFETVLVPNSPLQRKVLLWAPTEGAPEGTNSIVDWDEAADCVDAQPGPIFDSDGSANCGGAFRFTDQRGNFLETRVLFPATGKIVIRKWFGGNVDTDWYENGQAGKKWTW